MSMFIFPRNVGLSYRLFNGLLVKSARRWVVGPADDVTKYASGYLQKQDRDYTRGWCLHSCKCATASFLHLNYFQCNTALKEVNSLGQTAVRHRGQPLVFIASYSTNAEPKSVNPKEETVNIKSTDSPTTEVTQEKLSIFQRFKRAYKEHGKILVAVHIATSIVWYGSFYTAARSGIDIVPLLEHWGFSETLIKPFRAGGVGDFALAYLMYKLATPLRYTVTLGGTNLVIRHLRSTGKMAPKSKEDSLRELYKEGKQKLKDSALRKDRLKRLRMAREKKKENKWRQGKHF